MSEDLSKKLESQASISGEETKKASKFKFNPDALAGKSFTPSFGSFNPGKSYAFNDFSSFAQPQQQQQEAQQSQQMSLEDYQKSKQSTNLNSRGAGSLNRGSSASAGLNTRGAGASAGPKKIISLPKYEPKETKAEPKETKVEPEVEPKIVTKAEAKETKPAAKAESKTKESSPAPKPKAEKDPKEKSAPAAPVDPDAVVKEQAKLDQEVVADMFGDKALKEHMSIIFMGHVDAGKSTMGGNLLYLTGSVDKRTIDKYEREAQDAGRQGWYLSWVMDTNSEERNEGKTIEVGRAVFETEKRRYTILDAPGHKMYVPSMIGGASQADAGILVISARTGEYETGFEKGGQTREHAVLAKTQGVDRICVVINKLDDPTVNWSKDRYDECCNKVGPFLKNLGYSDITFMPVSGYTGAGLKDRVPKDLAPYYDGPSLLEWLDNLKLENRKISAPFMLPVSGKAKDLGTVVEGKIESGSVKKGANLLMMPNRQAVEVAGIYNEQDEEINGAIVGEQIKIKLKGIDEEEIQIGFVLTSSENPIKAVTKFQAQVAILDIKSILTAGFSCIMHVHAAVEEVTFTKLLHKLEKGTNRRSKKAPAFAKKGMKIIAELETTSNVCIEEFDKTPQLGRFTLRDQGQTIAIGKVTKILE